MSIANCCALSLYSGVEIRLREASRQLSSSEDAREHVTTELAELRQQAREGQNWEIEKQVQ